MTMIIIIITINNDITTIKNKKFIIVDDHRILITILNLNRSFCTSSVNNDEHYISE